MRPAIGNRSGGRRGRTSHLATFFLCTWLAVPGAAAGQGLRGTATTTGRVIEFRPLEADTIDPSLLETDPDGTIRLDGQPIDCRAGIPCILYRPSSREAASALSQDVRLTAWGFGVTGLSATAFMRVRANGGDVVWPRTDDAFDAMLAYVEWDRSPVRVRLGRQQVLGGLGFSSYDGASVLYRRGRSLSAELYAGRSLARGLSSPRSEVLQSFEDFVPDPSVILIGTAVSGTPVGGVNVAGRYQREMFADRGALAAERASLDAVVTRFGRVRLTAAADWDFAFGRVGKAHIRGRIPLDRGFAVEATARRYVPYFELWTIWGFFDPVGYNEAEVLVAWNDGIRMGASAAASVRRYGDTGIDVIGPTIERDTRRIALSAWWRPRPEWTFDGSFRRETGFGASFGGGDASVRWDGGRTALRASFTAFEQIEEFRVGEGSVVGGGVDGTFRVGDRIAIDGGISVYRHLSDRVEATDWNQRRAFLSLRIDFGRDPGIGPGGGSQ